MMNIISGASFFIINWVFLYINIKAVYSIRHMKDRLNIRLEMTYIVLFWFLFDTVQYFFYEINQFALCPIIFEKLHITNLVASA